MKWIQFQFFGLEPIRKPYYYIWVTLEHAWLPLPDLMHSCGRPDIESKKTQQKKDAAQPSRRLETWNAEQTHWLAGQMTLT